jgi:hypothetical protein
MIFSYGISYSESKQEQFIVGRRTQLEQQQEWNAIGAFRRSAAVDYLNRLRGLHCVLDLRFSFQRAHESSPVVMSNLTKAFRSLVRRSINAACAHFTLLVRLGSTDAIDRLADQRCA